MEEKKVLRGGDETCPYFKDIGKLAKKFGI
jgi:hypothetical protein